MLVTGATGFVGAHLVKALQGQGQTVRVLHRKNSDLSPLQGLQFQSAVGDITDPASLQPALQGVDSVFHLAALIAYSKAQRDTMQRINVEGTRHIVQACLQAKVSKLVHMSSVAAIGAGFSSQQILNEDSPYNLAHLKLAYHDTKRAAEQVVLEAVKQHDLKAVVVNPSVIYGAGDATKGSRAAQRKVARGRLPIYPPGGANVVSVHEVVPATLAAWQRGRVGERYILGGQNITIRDMFNIIARHAGVPAPRWPLPGWLLHALGRVGDGLEAGRGLGKKQKAFFINSDRAWAATLFHYFDSSKAERELALKIRPADEPIAESLNWMKQWDKKVKQV